MKKFYALCLFTLLSVFSVTVVAQRTTDQLQSLFTFQEGNGNYIKDVSGVGEPLILKIHNSSAVQWLPTGGLDVNAPVLIKSLQNAYKISDACMASNAITIEAWIKTESTTQSGPARIVTLSFGTSNRNFSIIQNQGQYSARVRTTTIGVNGTPGLDTPSGSVSTNLQHIVYTRSATGSEKWYINGVQSGSGTRTGNFSNWEDHFELALANEIDSDRPWKGEYHLLAVYSKSLSLEEVQQNYNAGASQSGTSFSSTLCSNEECFVDGYGVSQRILWLPGPSGPSSVEYSFDDNGGHLDVFPDGTAHFYGTTYNEANSEYGWIIDAWFTNKMNWSQWSALGRSWKGDPNIVGNLYQTWDYYIMDTAHSNTLTGVGLFAGSVLNLTHRPSDYEFGLQVGVGANDKNILPGFSCWFNYSGQLNGSTISGNGDWNGEGDCVNLPVVECVVDITVDCSNGYTPEITGTPIVYCEDEYSLTYSDEIVSSGCTTTVVRTWTAVNTTGDLVTCEQTITVLDTTAPVITPVPNVFADCNAFLNWEYSATDQCDPMPTVEVNTGSPMLFNGCVYQVQVTVTASDDCGNSTSEVFTVLVHDETAPSFEGIPVEIDVACDQIPPAITQITNDCWGINYAVSVQETSFSGACLPTIQRIYTVTDNCGRTTTFTQYIHVYDNVAPTFTFIPSNYQIDCSSFEGYELAQAEDLCSSVEMTYTVAVDSVLITNGGNGDCNFVTYTQGGWGAPNGGPANYRDAHFASAFPNGLTVGCGGNTFHFTSAQAIENFLPAGGNSYVISGNTVNPINVSNQLAAQLVAASLSVGFDAADANFAPSDGWLGYAVYSSGIFEGMTVQQLLEIANSHLGGCANNYSLSSISSALDVLNQNFLEGGNSGNLYCPSAESYCGAVHTVTFTATDACGNLSTAVQTITIIDNEAPQPVGALEDLILNCGNVPEASSVQFFDACGEVEFVTFNETTTGENCNQVITRTWIGQDYCGNSATYNQTITIIDDEAPVIAGVPGNAQMMCGSIPNTVNPIAVDNCSEVTLTLQETWQNNNGCADLIRTWTATDACGNSSSATQIISFVDEIPPVLQNVPASINASCGSIPPVPNVLATDNCDSSVEVTLSETIESTSCGLIVVRTWTATDNCGNSDVETQTLTLTDQQAPIFANAPEQTISCNQLPSFTIAVNDDCTLNPILTYVDQISGDECNQTIVRTWTATDNCGNQATYNQVIHVVDTTAPTFSNVPLNVLAACGSTVPVIHPLVSDNCDGSPEVIFQETQSGNQCNLLITRTWTATDNCGNVAVVQQLITLSDNQAPLLHSIPSDEFYSCSEYVYAAPPTSVFATDNCSAVNVLYQEQMIPGPCPNTFDVVRTWTAIDACGQTAVSGYTIHVYDDEGPVFDNLPQDVSIECGQIAPMPVMTARDNCGDVMITFSENTVSGGCPLIVRTWTATDMCGNQTQAIQFVELTDNQPPLITGVPPGGDVTCNGIPPVPTPFVTDNCDMNVDVSMNQTIIGSGCEFMLIRTFIAEDDCGNSYVVSQVFNVTDDSPPVFLNPVPEVTVSCGNLPSFAGPVVSDDCSSNVETMYSDQILGSGCNYDILRTYIAQDLCGNQATFTQLIHVVDQTGPVFFGVPGNSFANCNAIPNPPNVTANDACSGAAVVSFSQTTIGTGCASQIVRTWTATDNCGNTASVTRIIFVTDNTPPVFVSVPGNVTLSCGSAIPPVVSPLVTDNCSLSGILPTVSLNESIVSNSCGQLITRTWTATDACGNTSFATQTVNITDNQAPVIAAPPADITVTCDDVPAPATLSASDNCSAVEVLMTEQFITGVCPYVIQRTWTAIDACGNSTSVSQNIFIIDEEAPVILNVPDDLSVNCDAIPDPADLIAVDNCSSGVTLSFDEWTEYLMCGQLIYRTWTATDMCGNESSATQVITALDTANPVVLNTYTDMDVSCGELPPVVDPIVEDCSHFNIMFEEIGRATACENQFSLVRIWTIYDGCGNSTTISQNLIANDTIAPVLSVYPVDTLVLCQGIPEMPEVVATDACSGDLEVTVTETTNILSENGGGSCTLENAQTSTGEVAIWLPNLQGYFSDYVFSDTPGTMVHDEVAGTVQITGLVHNAQDPNQQWIINILLQNERSWDEWSALGRSYKDDAGAAGNNYVDWSYFEMDPNSTLTGAGSFEGTVLHLSHAPGDYYYGFQWGEGANNHNAAFGLSGWFYYFGQMNGTWVVGVGDLMTENNCCPEQEIVRTWTATDCAGNTVTHTQTIHVVNYLSSEWMTVAPEEDNSLKVTGSTGEFFIIDFNLYHTGQTEIGLYDMNGNYIQSVYSGNVVEKTNYRIMVEKEGLPEGIYLIQLKQRHLMLSAKEIVMK